MRKLKLPGRDKTRPRLDENDIQLIRSRGIDQVKKDAENIVREKLKQPGSDPSIPSAGNPIYKAMHACNSTSRDQLLMSHRIRPERELTETQVKSITNLLIRWIVREHNFFQEEKRKKQEKLNKYG